MSKTSEFLNRISESETLAAARIARELKQSGKDVIALNIGEPDFNTPDFIKDAAKKAIDDNYSKYPPVNGYLELRETISKKFKRDNKLDYHPDNILVSTGAKHSLVNAILAVVEKGDEVILFTPYWVSYRAMVELAGAKVVEAAAGVDQDYKVTPSILENAISDKTKMLIFSSPCNPTGSVYSEKELRAIAKVLEKHPNILVISDEIYEHINFVGQHFSIGQCSEIADRVITVNGVSKSFAMTGYRIGYMGGPTWVIKAATKLQGQFTSGANGIAQIAAKAALEAPASSVHYMRDDFEKRKSLVLEKLNEIPGLKVNNPDGAFYVFPEVKELFGKKTKDGQVIANAGDFCQALLEDQYVSVVSGSAFGAPNCFRISYATAESDLIKALDRMKAFVLSLD
ncbi:pyridoxal phosphate-dependent aminotransferase [Luteibaculum oceani]|uniref:Aminotransferase n=1 Tax=Luteibaculum oceani TaxID=1294296 RepID=A0A5C6V1K3_9FLAO|nr:pyridoxal phosphate-dependent aminotransferase [Luteibaculum oceani]TXC78551.1 pyridoxal phosphate-dependent aminotransferase [Luteibaculum oceani]